MLFVPQMSIMFAISTSNNPIINKIYGEVVYLSLIFTIISMEPQDHDKPIIGIKRVPVNGLIMILKFYAWNRSISVLQLEISCLKFSPVWD